MESVASSKEEEVLSSYFLHLSTFSYDRARDLLEKEKEGGKGIVSRWSQFISVLVQLCTVEKQYTNLTFLQTRGFLRKDSPLRGLYENIATDLENISDVNEASETEDEITSVASDVIVLVKGRIRAMDVYEKLSNISKQHIYAEVQPVVRTIATTAKELDCAAVSAWKKVFFIEIGILLDCVNMCLSLQSWQFFPSLTHLQNIVNQLNTWADLVQNRETRKLSFASSLLRGVSGQTDPYLYLWFAKLRSALASKFSLYFYQVLAKQTSVNDMRAQSSKLPVDYASKLVGFHRRVDATTVCLVFNANGVPGYKGPGYHVELDTKEGSPPTGLDLFPSIFAHPAHPTQHWPNIVMILTDKDYQLSQDRIFSLYDAGLGITFFLQMIEPRFTLVAMFEGRKSERDAVINTFFQETTQQLRMNRVMNSLKPGSK